MSAERKPPSVGEQVLTGTLWLGSYRWSSRLIGLVSTIITARLLLPDDFGVAATAMIVVAFFDILIDLGTDNYLVRLPDAQREDYDTAWTLRLCVVSVAAVLAFFAAAPAAALFGDARLVAVIQVLAVASLLRGFTNIGLTMYRRDMAFGRIAMIGVTQRLIGFAVTVILAFALRNYWAVIVGEFAFHASGLILSYVYHPYRPRLCTAQLRKQWAFCRWIVARNLAGFLLSRGDQFVVAKFFGMEKVGFYAMAIRFAEMPTKHFTAPMLMPVYAALAKKQGEPEGFGRSVRQVIGATVAVMLPVATLFAMLSEELVAAVLGANWTAAVPLMAPMVFTLLIATLVDPAASILTLLGRVRLLAALHWFSALAVIVVMFGAAQWGDLVLLAWMRVALAFALLLAYYRWVRLALALGWRSLLACIHRPVLAALSLAAVVAAVSAAGLGTWATILLGSLSGVAVYVVTLYGLWRITSPGDAGEALLARKALLVLGRGAARLRR